MDKCMHMVIHTLHYLTLHHITSNSVTLHSVHTYRPAYLHHAVPLYIRLNIYEHMENQIKKKKQHVHTYGVHILLCSIHFFYGQF